MCGIVGVASGGPMTAQMKEFFTSLLFHDVVRGHHATGVAAIDTLDRSLTVEKAAVPSPMFLEDKERMENLFNHKHNFNIYIGHNRWATMGDKSKDENAHPFVHGNIVGVHNGSLRNQKLLEDHVKFDVDSDNLYYHLNKKGLDDTLENLNGAFALVWYDRSDNSLNFIRNDERPLAIAKLSNGCYVWASEMGMLRWLVSRHKSLRFDTIKEDGVETQCCWSLEKGTHMKFEFNDKSRVIPVPTKEEKTLKTFPHYNNYDNYSNWYGHGTRSSNGSTSSTVVSSGRRLTGSDEVARSFLPNGDSFSYLEVKYVGRIQPVSPAGYTSDISLFDYVDINGITHRFHCYNHTANKVAAALKPEDIGRMMYAQFGSACEKSSYHCDEIICLNTKSMAMSLINVTEKPTAAKAYFCYWTPERIEERKAIQEKKNQARTEEGQKDSQGAGKVVPIETAREAMTNSNVRVKFANMSHQANKTRAVFDENNHMCANCAKRLGTLLLADIYLLQHFDDEDATLRNYLTCSKKCHDSMEEYCDEIDRAWAMKRGAIND